MTKLLRASIWPLAGLLALALTFCAASALAQDQPSTGRPLWSGETTTRTGYVTIRPAKDFQTVPVVSLNPKPGGVLEIMDYHEHSIIVRVNKDGSITGDPVRALRMLAAALAAMRLME